MSSNVRILVLKSTPTSSKWNHQKNATKLLSISNKNTELHALWISGRELRRKGYTHRLLGTEGHLDYRRCSWGWCYSYPPRNPLSALFWTCNHSLSPEPKMNSLPFWFCTAATRRKKGFLPLRSVPRSLDLLVTMVVVRDIKKTKREQEKTWESSFSQMVDR